MSQIATWPITDPQWHDTKLITLQKILQETTSGGGSGSGAQEIYWDRDPAAPDDAAKPAISLDTATGVATYWDGAAWV